MPMPHVVLVVPLVDTSSGLLGDSLALPRPLHKLPLKTIPILPDIPAVAMRFAVLELPSVLVSIHELLFTLAVLEELSKIASVGRIVLVNEVALSILLVVLPLALVVVSPRRLPHPESILFAVLPLALEALPVVPREFALPVPLSIFERTDVETIRASFRSLHLLILLIDALVDVVLCQGHPCALFDISLPHLSEVQLVLKGKHYEVRLLSQVLEIEIRTNWLVVDENGTNIFIFLKSELLLSDKWRHFLLLNGFLQTGCGILALLIVVEHGFVLSFGLRRSAGYDIVDLICLDIQFFPVPLGSCIIFGGLNFSPILEVDVVLLTFRGLESSHIDFSLHLFLLLILGLLLLQWMLFLLRLLPHFQLVVALHSLLVFIVHQLHVFIMLDRLSLSLSLVISDLYFGLLVRQILIPIREVVLSFNRSARLIHFVGRLRILEVLRVEHLQIRQYDLFMPF